MVLHLTESVLRSEVRAVFRIPKRASPSLVSLFLVRCGVEAKNPFLFSGRSVWGTLGSFGGRGDLREGDRGGWASGLGGGRRANASWRGFRWGVGRMVDELRTFWIRAAMFRTGLGGMGVCGLLCM